MDLRNAKNVLVQQLSPSDRDRLGPEFDEIKLAFKQPMLEQGSTADYVYFVERGVISMVTDLREGESIEVATIGNEGLVGLGAVLGGAPSPGRTFCQIPGAALRVPVSVIVAERTENPAWFDLLLRYASFTLALAAQNAACNRRHNVDARMSRWLLMTHDRVLDDDFPLTQEFLAQMLGVARPTVNIAGAILQRAGFIKYSRGRVAITDRAGLESAACECYSRIREELESCIKGQPSTRRARVAARGRHA